MIRVVTIAFLAGSLVAAGAFPALGDAADENEAEAISSEIAPIASLRKSLRSIQTARIDLGSGISFKDRTGDKQPGFLYLKSPEAPNDAFRFKSRWLFEATTGFTPRQADSAPGLRLTPGESWILRGFTPRSAAAEISLSFGSADPDLGGKRKFDVSLSSNLSVSETDFLGLSNNPALSQALARQSYEVDLNIGYAGFGLAAGLRGQDSLADTGYSGYDLGIFYEGHRFYTNILVGEYRRKLAGLPSGLASDDLNYYSLQVGASYRLGSSLNLTGGFRLIGYGKGYVFEADRSSLDQVLYLGTRLTF